MANETKERALFQEWAIKVNLPDGSIRANAWQGWYARARTNPHCRCGSRFTDHMGHFHPICGQPFHSKTGDDRCDNIEGVEGLACAHSKECHP